MSVKAKEILEKNQTLLMILKQLLQKKEYSKESYTKIIELLKLSQII